MILCPHEMITASQNFYLTTFGTFKFQVKLVAGYGCMTESSSTGLGNPWHACRTWHASSFLWRVSQATETSQRKSSSISLTEQHIAL